MLKANGGKFKSVNFGGLFKLTWNLRRVSELLPPRFTGFGFHKKLRIIISQNKRHKKSSVIYTI